MSLAILALDFKRSPIAWAGSALPLSRPRMWASCSRSLLGFHGRVAGQGFDAADSGGHGTFTFDAEGADGAVARTWMPPQSSFEEPNSIMRTVSPCFSPNNIMAPPLRVRNGHVSVLWHELAKMRRCTSASIWAAHVGDFEVREVEAQTVGLDKQPFCSTWVPSTSRKAS